MLSELARTDDGLAGSAERGAGRRARRAALYRLLRRLHVAIFFVAAIPLVVTSLSGALLVFGHELEALVVPPNVVTAPPDARPLAPTALLARIAEQRPDDRVWSVMPAQTPDRPAALWLAGGKGRLEVDPYTGDILAHVQPNSLPYDVVRALHRRWLVNSRPASDWTRTIISSASLVLMVQIVIGLWLWALPGKAWQRLRPAFGRNRRLMWQGLHMLSGVLTSILLLLVAFTGLSMYWNDSTKPIIEALTASKVEQMEKPALDGLAPVADLDVAVAFARDLMPAHELLSYRPEGTPFVAMHAVWRNPGTHVNSVAWIGDNPLRVLRLFDGREASLATWVWQFRYWFHLGDFAGWPIKVLWIFVGLAPVFFIFTGLWLWRDRRH